MTTLPPTSQPLPSLKADQSALSSPVAPDGPGVYANPGGERFQLTLDQMGRALPRNLAAFNSDPTFKGVVKIQLPPFNWEELRQRTPPLEEHHELRFVQWGSTTVKGVSLLTVAPYECPEWQMPELLRVDRPSYKEAWAPRTSRPETSSEADPLLRRSFSSPRLRLGSIRRSIKRTVADTWRQYIILALWRAHVWYCRPSLECKHTVL